MSFTKALDLLEERKEVHLSQLFTLLKQKSISAQNVGVEECAELLRSMLEDSGIESRLLPTKGHPVVYGQVIRDPEALTVLFYGHYDVQPPDPLDAWLSPPFEPTIRDGKIYCRGAGDNKGQLLAHVLAVKACLDALGELPINVKMVFEGEEESGSKSLASFVMEHKDLLAADLVYTSDGPMHYSGAPFVLLGVRGVLKVELRAKGADWDNHSGNKGNIVPNPAWTLIDLLGTMRNDEGRVLIEGFYDNIRPSSEYERQLLKELPFDRERVAKEVGYPALDMDGETYYRLLTMEPTLNICGFHSGYGGEGTKTIIPSTATVKMDIRLVVDQDPKDVFAKLAAHVQTYAPSIEAKYMGAMKPSRTPADHELIGVVTQAVQDAYAQEPILQPSLGGSLPSYVWTDILALPSIVVPYANSDEANHSPNENIGLENFYQGIRCTCHVIKSLGEYANTQGRGNSWEA